MAIDIIEDIIPVTKVRDNLSAIIDRARETKRPIVVTQNGSAAVIILDAAQYQKEQEASTYLQAVLDGLLSEGEVTPEEVEARLDAILSE
jgi:prevent-host-death family protein